MRVAIVPASKLSTKDLRASAYVTNPRKVARAVVKSWCELYPVMALHTEGAKRLIELIEVALRTELDRNRPEKKQATKKLSAQEKQAMLDALSFPSAADVAQRAAVLEIAEAVDREAVKIMELQSALDANKDGLLCSVCMGTLENMGVLGKTRHYKCRNCGLWTQQGDQQ